MRTRREIEDEIVELVFEISGETIKSGEFPEEYLEKILNALRKVKK